MCRVLVLCGSRDAAWCQHASDSMWQCPFQTVWWHFSVSIGLGLPSRNWAWTILTEHWLFCFCFFCNVFFYFMDTHAGLSWPHCRLFNARNSLSLPVFLLYHIMEILPIVELLGSGWQRSVVVKLMLCWIMYCTVCVLCAISERWLTTSVKHFTVDLPLMFIHFLASLMTQRCVQRVPSSSMPFVSCKFNI